jgi:hypothetical protein
MPLRLLEQLKELWLWWIFGSYQSDPKEALRSSIRIMKKAVDMP